MEVDVYNTPGGGDPKSIKVEDVDSIQEALVDVRVSHVCHGSELESKREKQKPKTSPLKRKVIALFDVQVFAARSP